MSADRITEISLSRVPGMDGSGDHYVLELRADGTSHFEGHTLARAKPREVRFTARDFQALAAEFERLDFFALADSYSDLRTCQRCTVISAMRDGVWKRVVFDGPAGPESLPELLSVIFRFAQIEWDRESGSPF